MAISEILLTSENYVRSISNIDNNVESKYLLSSIREAQEIGLQGIIGTAMLNKLKSLIGAGTINNPENLAYKSLLNESQLYLAYKTTEQLCLICNVKISNGGLQQTADENLTVLNVNDTFTVQNHYADKADFFAKRLQSYIIQNISDLPEISESKCSEIRATLDSAASTSLWLGGKRSRCSYWKNNIGYIGK